MIWLTGIILLYFSVDLMGNILPGLGAATASTVRPNSEILALGALPGLASIAFLIAGIALVRHGLKKSPGE